MRYIRKSGEPQEFKTWKRKAAREPGGATFRNVVSEAKEALVGQMLSEQGCLCAYTMWRLGDDVRICIEHIYCQQHHPERALDYANMVLCAKGTKKTEFGFGESRKGNLIVTEANFVSPLQRNCENRFTYHDDGTISATKPNDEAAKHTIDKLKLDDNTLQAARRQAIRVQVIGDGKRKPISIAKARELAQAIADTRRLDALPAFAIAIKQSALRFVRTHEKVARRLAARQDR